MIDVEFLLKNYKKEKEEKKENKSTKFEFTLSDGYSGGVRAIKSAINQLRAFCYKEGFDIEVYENYGWLFGSAEFVIKGTATKSYIEELKRSYNKWVSQWVNQY